MLTSSDAKWRCMWHMLVWSISLSLASQFLEISSHVAFYIIAAISILVLPVLTAVYSNTSGRHGAGLLRAGLVFCDPVLACITVTPSILLNQLPGLVDEYACLRLYTSWNSTLDCVLNHSDIQDKDWYVAHVGDSEAMRQHVTMYKKQRYLVIEGAIVTPILLALVMCKRTRKMRYNTFLVSCGYWLVLAVEAVSLLENVLLEDVHKHIVYTTEAMISVVSILSASYAVITLLSYLSPVAPNDYLETETESDRFDFLYRAFVGTVSVLFCEIPLIVARFRMLALDEHRFLPGTFYVWLIKDCVFVVMILVLIYGQRFGSEYLRLPCKSDDQETAFQFEPEKRDRYIHQHQKDTRYSSVLKSKDKPEITDKEIEMTTIAVNNETNDMRKAKRIVTGVKSKSDSDRKVCKEYSVKEKDCKQTTNDSTENEGAKDATRSVSASEMERDENATKKRASAMRWSDSDDSDEYRKVEKPTAMKQSNAKQKGLSPNKEAKKERLQTKRERSSDASPKKGQNKMNQNKGGNVKEMDQGNEVDSPGSKTISRDSTDNPAKERTENNEKSPKENGNKYIQKEKRNSDEKKDTRRVMFQFDIGEGKAIAIKSRSDSPGVIIDAQEGGDA